MKLCVTKRINDILAIPDLKELTIDDFTWHVNLHVINHQKFVLFTHALTGFTLYLAPVSKKQFNRLDKLFYAALEEAFLAHGYIKEAINGYIEASKTVTYGKTSNRSVISQSTVRFKYMFANLSLYDASHMFQTLLGVNTNQLLGKIAEPMKLMEELLATYLPKDHQYSAYVFDFIIDLGEKEVIRRLAVPSNYTLYHLHYAIQTAFGFENAYFHYFQNQEDMSLYTIVLDQSDRDQDFKDELMVPIDILLTHQIHYLYADGMGWEFHIVHKETLTSPNKIACSCIYHEQENLPNHVDGLMGYGVLMAMMHSNDETVKDNAKKWIKLNIKPFDLERVNKELKRLSVMY